LAKPNYQFERRQRDLAKKKKQEEKRQRKLAARTPADGDPGASPETSEPQGTDPAAPVAGEK
jgi:hypothetical protein